MKMGSSEEAMDIIKAIGARDRIIRDLLVALQEVLKTLEGYDVDYPEVAPVFDNAYAAIAKATGDAE